MRILDEEGAFVKEAKITPKKIAILDDFGIDRYEHGEQVLTYAKRHNPFAIYTKLEHSDLPKKINDLIKTLENNQYDYINFSSGKPIRINDVVNMLKQLSPKELAKIGLNKKMQKNLNLDKRKIEELRDFYIKALREYPELSKSNAENELILYLDDLCTKNTRVLVASGNHLGFGFLNNKYLYIGKNLEGVGSLSSEGRISHFSSSRNKGYTKHYEVSESQLRETPYGYNFTGKAGTDSTKSELPYCYEGEKFEGTSFATPIRTAKLALNDMMEGIL